MKKIAFNLTCLLTYITVASAISTSYAQQRVLKLKKGDVFERQIIVNSNCLLQRGEQKLNLSTYAAVTKSYKVNTAEN